MVKRKEKPSWKPVRLTESLLSKGIEGLIGIEELTDYSFSTNKTDDNQTIVCNSAKKSSLKRKRNKLQTEEQSSEFEAKKGRKDEESDEETVEQAETAGMEAWNGLGVPDSVLQALSELGFNVPTQIQTLTLPPAVFGRRDILGAAETGSGKTLAFGIPIINGILELKKNQEDEVSSSDEEEECGEDSRDVDCVKVVHEASPAQQCTLYALILTPTRELAIQVRRHLVAAAKHTGIKVAVVVGGMAMQKQERILRKRPEIVVATPGRLWELIEEGNPHLTQVNNIRFLAIDETDRMVEKGHFQELQTLLERINSDDEKRKQRQNFVFSATLTLVHETPKYRHKAKRITPGQKLNSIISMLGISNPKVVDVTQASGTCQNLSEARILCALDEKDFYLYYFLKQHAGRTLVFCNSISCVRRLAQLLNLLQCKPFPLHANMIQRQRLKNLERFHSDPNGLLLATDVAARGLDIPNVQHVIHYQVPRTSETYVHRSGRTARAQKEGLTLLLIEPSEITLYTRLCRTLGRERDLPTFPVVDSMFTAVKERVKLSRDLDQLELASRRNNAQSNWFSKAVKDMDIVLDYDDLPKRFSEDTSIGIKAEAALKRKQLNSLLKRNVFQNDLGPAFERSDAVQTLKLSHKPGMFVRRRI